MPRILAGGNADEPDYDRRRVRGETRTPQPVYRVDEGPRAALARRGRLPAIRCVAAARGSEPCVVGGSVARPVCARRAHEAAGDGPVAGNLPTLGGQLQGHAL